MGLVLLVALTLVQVTLCTPSGTDGEQVRGNLVSRVSTRGTEARGLASIEAEVKPARMNENEDNRAVITIAAETEVDMALGPFAISYPRTKVAEFPAAIFVLPHRVYLPRPRGFPDVSDFVRLYHPLVWTMVFVCAGVVTVALWLAAKTESSRQNTHPSTLFLVLLHVWGALMLESMRWSERGVSRWLMGLWSLMTLVLMSTYSGALVATLTVPRVAIPIKSVEQLVSQDDIPWRLEQGGIILHTFKVVKPELDHLRPLCVTSWAQTADVKMYKKLLKGSEGLFPDCYASRTEIAQGEFAGLCDVLAGDMMVAKSFSVSGRLRQLQERGWVKQLVKSLVNNGTVCSLPPGQEEGQLPPTPLSVQQMWGVFAILAAGVGGAALVFLLEVVWCKTFLTHQQ
ncbi:Glutamate receptor ionotropic, kainate 2-like 16 [Homarus americanus]|uniref:Glutamate receptor ionotropic, kainate 2-like 16 n=1 Tax=Homarus americanus TaxID=6706 RepID=A0A8J5JHL3_HOMAM|nr:Glutamate receptor ionotropic, kainate 2-like 16 [Homarus americanus]